jgi:hypothetical protein
MHVLSKKLQNAKRIKKDYIKKVLPFFQKKERTMKMKTSETITRNRDKFKTPKIFPFSQNRQEDLKKEMKIGKRTLKK